MRRRFRMVKPLVDVLGKWDGRADCPVRLRVAMDNGTFASYTLAVPDIKPHVPYVMSPHEIIGYKYHKN